MYPSPFKQHRKKKLSVCLDRSREEFGWWNCWISDESGKSLYSLMKRAGHGRAFSELGRLLEGQAFRHGSWDLDDEDDEERVELPEEFRPLSTYSEDWAYMGAFRYITEERGFGLAEIAKYNIGYCCEGRYAGRVIVPSYSGDGSLNYFVARDYHWDSDIKYLNPRAPRDTIVFGSRITWSQPVTLVEGVFDAMAARRNAIPLLGKRISPALRDKLSSEKPPKVYLALDRDAISDAGKLAEDLSLAGLDVRVAWLGDEDPADMGFEAFQRRLRSAEQPSLHNIVRMRLE
jgi:hypothetical protein